MPYVRQPGEKDVNWLKLHVGQETETEWRERTTPPHGVQPVMLFPPGHPPGPLAVASKPTESFEDWQRRIGGRRKLDNGDDEPEADWKDRVCQKYPGEQYGKYSARIKAWSPQAAPGGAASGGGAYTPPPTPAAPTEEIPQLSTNAVTATVRVAKPADCKRVRLAYHIFEIEGVKHNDMIRNVRRRTYRWVRRVYAAANIAPRIVEEVNTVPLKPPVPNMISCVNWETGKFKAPAAGGSQLTIELSHGVGAVTVEVNLTKGMTPAQLADAIKLAVESKEEPLGTQLFQAEIEAVPLVKTTDPNTKTIRTVEAADIFITFKGDKKPAQIKKMSDNDASQVVVNAVVQVPGLNKKWEPEFKLSADADLPGGDPSQRRVLRMGRPGEDDATVPKDDRIDIYVVPDMQLAGRAYSDYPQKGGAGVSAAGYLPTTHLKNAAIMAYIAPVEGNMKIKPIDENDTAPFTLPHEICHVLAQTGHTEATGDIMSGKHWPLDPNDSGIVKGKPDTQGVMAAKHIYSAPLLTGSQDLKENETGVGSFETNQDMRKWMHERGAHLLENW